MKKVLLGVFALVLAFGASAFTSASNRATERWHFISGNPLTEARNAEAYELVSTPQQSCNTNPGKPCIIQFDNSNSSTPDLEAYLSTFSSDADVALAAQVTRSN